MSERDPDWMYEKNDMGYAPLSRKDKLNFYSSLDLNNLVPYSKYKTKIDTDFTMSVKDSRGRWISVIFRDIKKHLCDLIEKSDFVYGCVAWLTDRDILECLSKKEVSILVQKDDLWRPDISKKKFNTKWLKHKYAGLRCSVLVSQFKHLQDLYGVSYDSTLSPLRCVGQYSNNVTNPRMHNKFLLFCRILETDNNGSPSFLNTYGVWTGSFNFSKTAGLSFENAVYFHEHKSIIHAYHREFCHIYSLSQSLNWSSDLVIPEYMRNYN